MKTIEPKQKRSADRMALLLDTTAKLIAKNGISGFALSHVAKQSKISQGSLYQYVASKDALISALHRRHADRILQILVAFERDMANVPADQFLDVLVERIVNNFAPFYAENPSYGAIRQFSASLTVPLENDIDKQIVAALIPMLKSSFKLANTEEYALVAIVLLEIADALMLQVSVGEDWQRETKLALRGYLAAKANTAR